MPTLALLGALTLQGSPALDPDAERARFRLPEGFSVELVLCEPDVRKVVDVAFDDAGSMWAVTACEYPLDGNESERAAELYRNGGRDQVVVLERPWEGERRVPRVFADGLAMPMSVLPLGRAAIVQHGSEILRLEDVDGDGRADRREVLLSGFGIEDSHLLPHRFLRAPDGWIYLAQGAFNHSQVLDRSGRVTPFERCKLARFRDDGSRFEVVGVGLNNIWGIVFDERGEFLIQEANDLGFGVAPFVFGATYPGIGGDRFRPYAPVQPPATELRFGGTGLSGLAWTSSPAFREPFRGAVFVANPIENRVSAVRRHGRGLQSRFEALPHLIESDDRNFRPVAVHFGPDESLYVVDWYNPIISHNEVPRTHPDRDRERTRVWRVRPSAASRVGPPDLTRVDDAALVAALGLPGTFAPRAAWRQIVARRATSLAPALAALAGDGAAPLAQRMLALWSLEGLGRFDAGLAAPLLRESDPALRQGAVRALAAGGATAGELLALEPPPDADPELEVRLEWLRALAPLSPDDPAVLERVLSLVRAPDTTEAVECEQERTVALRGASLAAMRERMWVRIALEGRGAALLARFESGVRAPDAEVDALAGLALEGSAGARHLVEALARLERPATAEELELCARHSSQAPVARHLLGLLRGAQGADATLRVLLAGQDVRPEGELREAILEALARAPDAGLSVRAALRWEWPELAGALEALARSGEADIGLRRDAVRALARLRGRHEALFAEIFDQSLPGEALREEALQALCASDAAESIAAVLERLPDVDDAQARRALTRLSSSRTGAGAVVEAALAGAIDERVFDARLLESLVAALGDDARLDPLRARLDGGGLPVLRLDGGAEDYVDSDLSLAPPFTIEAWVACEEGIDNRDGLLALPGAFDFNFSGARPRLWLGPALGDVVIANTELEPGRWSHVAVSVDEHGRVRLYLDGELDAQADAAPFDAVDGLDVGRTTPGGAQLSLTELRVWSRERSAREIALGARLALDGVRPEGLLLRIPGDELRLSGQARLERRRDGPALADAQRHAQREATFARFAELSGDGSAERGAVVFARTCEVCHTVAGRGQTVGPPLDGLGARGLDGILAAVLEPSAAVESGYRELRVERLDGTSESGLLLRSDPLQVVVRPANASGASEPIAIPREDIARLRWSRLSVMPDGLLESLAPDDAADLLAYLLAL